MSDKEWLYIGKYSTVFGKNIEVSGNNSTGFGNDNILNSSNSLVFGESNTVGVPSISHSNLDNYEINETNGNIVGGIFNDVRASFCTCFGLRNKINFGSDYSICSGRENIIYDDILYSPCFGLNNEVSGNYSVIFEQNNILIHKFSSCFGLDNILSGDFCSCFGKNNEAYGDFSSCSGDSNEVNGNTSSRFGNNNKVSEDILHVLVIIIY